MLFSSKILVIAGLITLSSSCATIFSKSKYPVSIDSTPRGADITITNRRGEQVFSGKTPNLVRLKPGGGYFKPATYSIKITKEGFTSKTVELRATINGWYFGNIVLGGLLGLLIVDPATGAMYKLKQLDVNETLQSETKTAAAQTHQLRIYDMNEIPEAWRNKLVAIQ